MDIDTARLELVQASRILDAHGLVDGFGHVSCRSPQRPDRFLMSRSMAPALVKPEDIVEHDLQGEPISHPGIRVFLERFIHSEIYRRRPDIGAVVHSHSPSVLPFTVVGEARLQPICHVCGFLAGVSRPFDIADHAGPGTDLLVRTPELGRALAEYLGKSKVVLMRGHGFTAVGATVPHAVYRAVYTGINSEIQMAAGQLGRARFLSASEADACEETTLGQIDRSWDLWVRKFAGSH